MSRKKREEGRKEKKKSNRGKRKGKAEKEGREREEGQIWKCWFCSPTEQKGEVLRSREVNSGFGFRRSLFS